MNRSGIRGLHPEIATGGTFMKPRRLFQTAAAILIFGVASVAAPQPDQKAPDAGSAKQPDKGAQPRQHAQRQPRQQQPPQAQQQQRQTQRQQQTSPQAHGRPQRN